MPTIAREGASALWILEWGRTGQGASGVAGLATLSQWEILWGWPHPAV